MTLATRSRKQRSGAGAKLDADDAFMALLIAAADASGHASADEVARAHNAIWSMRRFRYRSGDAVSFRIARMQMLISKRGVSSVIEAAVRQIPRRLRRAAFAIAADLVLVDGRMQRSEERFLRGLAANLELDRQIVKSILDVIRAKNSA